MSSTARRAMIVSALRKRVTSDHWVAGKALSGGGGRLIAGGWKATAARGAAYRQLFVICVFRKIRRFHFGSCF